MTRQEEFAAAIKVIQSALRDRIVVRDDSVLYRKDRADVIIIGEWGI